MTEVIMVWDQTSPNKPYPYVVQMPEEAVTQFLGSNYQYHSNYFFASIDTSGDNA